MKRKFTVLALILFSIFNCLTILAPISAQDKDLKELTLMLDWYPNANHIPIYTAIENGYFEEEGIQLTIQMPAEADDPIKLASTGKTDLALSYPSVLIQAVGEELPVKAVGSLVQTRMDTVIFKEDSGIKTAKDLMGRKVGYAATTISENIIQSMVENDGGKFDEVEMVNVGWDLIPALATDKVDAITGAYINHELLLLEKEGYKVSHMDFADFGIPDTDELIFVAGDDTIATKSEEMQAFMRALKKGYDKAAEDPESAMDVLLSNEENDYVLDKEIERKSWDMLKDFMVSKGEFGSLKAENYQAFADFLFEHQTITRQLTESDLVHDLSK